MVSFSGRTSASGLRTLKKGSAHLSGLIDEHNHHDDRDHGTHAHWKPQKAVVNLGDF